MDEAAFLGIVDAIYAAATAYDAWPDALERLGGLFGCSCVSLIDRNLNTRAGRAIAWGVDDDSRREFIDVWGTRNVFVEHTRRWRPGAIETDRDILPKPELIASDYYNGFMKPRDMHAIMRLTLNTGALAGDGYNQILSLVRPLSAGDYESDDVAMCRRFVPHLQRAGRIARHLEATQVMLDGVTAMLERNPAGILLLDATGRIVFANESARAMARLDDGFTLKRGRIAARDPRKDAVLQSSIGRATSPAAPPDGMRGGAIRLGRDANRTDLNAVVAPLAAGRPPRNCGANCGANRGARAAPSLSCSSPIPPPLRRRWERSSRSSSTSARPKCGWPSASRWARRPSARLERSISESPPRAGIWPRSIARLEPAGRPSSHGC